MLNPTKLGLAAGILWALSMFLMTMVAMKTGYASEWLLLMANIYPGYEVSWTGSVIGMLYGFIDGFVALFLFGWLYNKLNA